MRPVFPVIYEADIFTAKKRHMTAPTIVFLWGIKMLNHIILTI